MRNKIIGLPGLALAGLFFTGCAFDVSHVRLEPVSFAATTGLAHTFVLNQKVAVKLGTGFPTRLNALTRWQQVGTTEYGDVFATKDQIVTVEASNVYEAQLVVSNRCIAGFYLPVDKKFVPVSQPSSIETNSVNQTKK